MRICDTFRCAIVVAALGMAGQADAFDAKNIKPNTPPSEAFKYGFNAYRQGDKTSAFEALSYAAGKGHPIAQWKLGRMYADGDGVSRNDYKAFQLFQEIADAHAEDSPSEPVAPFVSNAFVRLGAYFRHGIPNTPVKPNPALARQMYYYAASQFGDPSAQYALAEMYYQGEGGTKDLVTAAKWASLSAEKGNEPARELWIDVSLNLARGYVEGGNAAKGADTTVDAHKALERAMMVAENGNAATQAIYGDLLFQGDGVPRQPALGLMYLTVARHRAKASDDWILDLQERALAVATEEERQSARKLADDWLSKNNVLARR